MKHFFFSYNANFHENGILNGLFEKLEKNNEDEKLKVFYDAADIICDKRFEENDKELRLLVDGCEEDNISKKDTVQPYEIFAKYRSSVEMDKYYRIKALKMLWNYIEKDDSITIHKTKKSEEKSDTNLMRYVLYYLVKGNICLRISQCYYESYDLGNSDIWANRAIELLWHGKNLAARLRDSQSSRGKMQADLYLRLIKLNLAKYYRDYGRKNRRSDLDAALDEFKQVRKRVEEEIGQVSDTGMRRQYVLIWMDAIFNIAGIHRRKYQAEVTRREVLFCYNCLKKSSGLFSALIKNVDILVAHECDNIETLLNHPQIKEDLPYLCVDSFDKFDALDDYDKKRYFLLILLEIGRIYRDLHFAENYLCAMAIAVIVDQWSYEMDRRVGYMPGHNIDALITISSSLRKYIKFRDSANKGDVLPEKIEITTKGLKQSLYLRDEQGEKENGIASLNHFVQKLVKFAKNGDLKSKTEVIKWHCLYQQNPETLKSIRDNVGEYENIKAFLESESPNLQLRFLEGLVYLRAEKYIEAIKIFEELIAPCNKETQYVRLGTIGLKARYLLANCFMSLTEFSKAEKILKELQDTLAFAKKSRIVQGISGSTDSDIDARVEIDLGYCYMQRGEYEKAIEIYKKMYGDGGNNREKPDFSLPKIKRERQIMGLNNYAACCIFSSDDKKKENPSLVNENFEIARKLFSYMEQEQRGDDNWYETDPETNLLKGYYTLCMEAISSESMNTNEQALVDAHGYFRRACKFDDAFTVRYNLLDENGIGNKAKYRNEVERISVYIINLTKLYKLYLKKREQIETCQIMHEEEKVELDGNLKVTKEQLKYIVKSGLELERFLLSFPTTYKISLKAATALAEWLLAYEIDYSAGNPEVGRLTDQLYRSFSYVTIYEERGAQVFNVLRDNRIFRFFNAAKRGKFLALLLAMYKPIKAIKEECCFSLDDKKTVMNPVHYTRIENLKKLLADNNDCPVEEEGGKKEKPRFRINNCGYMNDVFEGNIFLKNMELVSSIIQETDSTGSTGASDLVKKYFPQLSRSQEDMLPGGSNVYIGSLSVKHDSFPLWSVYAENETGCNIEFKEGFFDINGNPCRPRVLRDYMISKYTDRDYPLYIVQYIGSKFKEEAEKYKESIETKKIDFEIHDTQKIDQHCGTRAIRYMDLCQLLAQIYGRWKQLDTCLEKDSEQSANDGVEVIREFAADRINEIRFLFKNADYEFEGEVRVIYTDFTDRPIAKTDESINVPKVYVDIDRDVEGVTIRLGSRIEDATVDKYVTWLKHTKRVQKVGLAKRNRYTT